MKKYFNDAQNLINQWTTYLKLPNLTIKISEEPIEPKNKRGAISIETATIIIWVKNIPNKEKFILTLLHELSHWWFYWNRKDKIYKNEDHVIKKSYSLLKKFYPKYYKKLKEQTCQ
jgi:Zn-dependent peptidase ImmA (M78 family)